MNTTAKKPNTFWLFHGVVTCITVYWAGRVYGLCVYFMMGASEGSTKSGSGETGNRACEPWLTRHSTYPLHQGMSTTASVFFEK